MDLVAFVAFGSPARLVIWPIGGRGRRGGRRDLVGGGTEESRVHNISSPFRQNRKPLIFQWAKTLE